MMPSTQVIIFGNPKGGTPLMIASPTVAIDLPLKALICEDGEDRIWVSYNSSNISGKGTIFPAHCSRILPASGPFCKRL
jgi:uncharacterized protein (DUF302 family)